MVTEVSLLNEERIFMDRAKARSSGMSSMLEKMATLVLNPLLDTVIPREVTFFQTHWSPGESLKVIE